MERVEAGVANFREFQVDARDFFSRADERAISEEMQRNRRDQKIKETLIEHNAKMNNRLLMAGIVIAFLTLAVAYMGYLESVKQQHGIFSLTKPDTVVSSTQHAGSDSRRPY